MKIILASNSPRRKEFLRKNGFEFEVQSSTFEEKNFTNDPIELTTFFAFNKAKNVFDGIKDKTDVLVIGADTVVCFNGQLLGKPKDKTDAKKMLRALSGKTHEVISAFAIVKKDLTIVDYDVTKVTFFELNDKLIIEYVNSNLPLDKAGSYGIQDGFPLVEKISGSFDNVVGLPTEKLFPTLQKLIN